MSVKALVPRDSRAPTIEAALAFRRACNIGWCVRMRRDGLSAEFLLSEKRLGQLIIQVGSLATCSWRL